MTRIFLIFKYFLHKKDVTAQRLVTVRCPTSGFFYNKVFIRQKIKIHTSVFN